VASLKGLEALALEEELARAEGIVATLTDRVAVEEKRSNGIEAKLSAMTTQYVARGLIFKQDLALEDAIGSHTSWLQASMRVANTNLPGVPTLTGCYHTSCRNTEGIGSPTRCTDCKTDTHR
jgi:hypothetical protein